jgi:hypothetical protein
MVKLIFFSVLTSLLLWFGAQEKQPIVCRGKVLPIALVPGPEMTFVPVPLRFGGTRPPPLPWFHSFPTKDGFRQVIKTRGEFTDLWKRLLAPLSPDRWVPPMPEVDFSKEMVIVAAMGQRPSSGYGIIIDGACECDGRVEVYVSSNENACGGAAFPVMTAPADAVRLPQTNLPVVFREIQARCPWTK